MDDGCSAAAWARVRVCVCVVSWQVLYVVDALRENLEPALELLAETVLVPTFGDDEIAEQCEVLAFLHDEMSQDQIVKELVQVVTTRWHHA